ncbi:DUF3299 domain-containing protein [Marinobacter sp. V034]|uniref:DUF3299 domain-containing protein n=1 Tax=Marinobacter sp. V034 TaxID=3459610 RepID=UPI00404401E3
MDMLSNAFRLLSFIAFLAAMPLSAKEWKEIEWTELMPPEDLNLLENMPPIDHDGGAPPLLPDEIMTGRVRPEMGDMPIRIPGFVVPLVVSDDMVISEFFLVPYFGACIHVPPPPPNQIIHITYPEGFTQEALYYPVWIEGVLRIETTNHDMGKSSYSIKAESIEPYEIPEQ